MMHIGALFYGYGGDHPVGWRHPGSSPWRPMDVAHSIEIARIAERAKLDLVFYADMAAVPAGDSDALSRGATKAARIDPLVLITALGMATSRIGLGATASTSYWEPYNLARIVASIDHVTGGRAAWNVVTSDRDEVAWNFGDDRLDDHDRRYGRADEFLRVVTGLWDSWEDGAEVVDRDSGVFFDPGKLHVLDHHGERFRVRGPLNVPRTPQGRPVILQAGASETGRRFAAEFADAIFSVRRDIETSKAFYDDMKARVTAFGRQPGDLAILEGVGIVVGETEEEAQQKQEWLIDHTPIEVGLWHLDEHLGAGLAGLDLDAPVTREMLPETAPGSQALFDELVEYLLESPSLRDAVQRQIRGMALRGAAGTAEQVADYLQERYEAGTADGFMVLFPTLPASLTDFTELVVPELQRRGLFRRQYEGDTLRDHLGVPVPPNRHTASAASAC